MKYLDCVRVIAEKEKYAKCGVHKGMQGVVWDGGCGSGEYSVYFTQRGEKPDIAEIPIEENDLKRIPVMHAVIDNAIQVQQFLKRNIFPFCLSHHLKYVSIPAFFDFQNEKIF